MYNHKPKSCDNETISQLHHTWKQTKNEYNATGGPPTVGCMGDILLTVSVRISCTIGSHDIKTEKLNVSVLPGIRSAISFGNAEYCHPRLKRLQKVKYCDILK